MNKGLVGWEKEAAKLLPFLHFLFPSFLVSFSVVLISTERHRQ
jgi:hypothetical protein